MDDTATAAEQKLEQCISSSWNLAIGDLKKYYSLVQEGLDYMSLYVAHLTTLRSIGTSTIKNTELFKSDPDIRLKLQHTIKLEMQAEELNFRSVLDSLQKHFSSILNHLEKIFNVYSSLKLESCEITKQSEMSLSIAEKLEALDKFKRFFTQDHMTRKHSIECYLVSDHLEKITSLWNTSEVECLQQELSWILFNEIPGQAARSLTSLIS